MGIPTFFRWLAERYPLICEAQLGTVLDKSDSIEFWKSIDNGNTLFGSSDAPEGFDNLYLDANGIIHNCSHSVVELCQNVKSEDDIFVSIFQFIINIVNIVRPKKLLYIAIDGVAPKAKILQQRERRFRAAADFSESLIIAESIKELHENTSQLTSNLTPTDSSSTEVQSNYLRPADSSSNSLPVNCNATPGDRGEESETINGSRGEVNREATTASGMKSSTGPQVEPAADLREAKGEVNKKASTASGKTSSVEADGRTTSDGTPSGKEGIETKESSYRFDPVQITPGTVFMERLTEAMKYFVMKMINEDENWRNLKVVVSGSDVPGEGEHKIMEYIRNDKARRYDEVMNEMNMDKKFKYISHCIYGLDADLIILSLVSHEPYICLLREQMVFTQLKNSTKIRLMINMNNYVLLHIGILREYIVNDLIEDYRLRNDGRIIDRVIDDFVLLSLFIGNDFLPHLLYSKIVDGNFNILLKIYREYISNSLNNNPNIDPWLTCNCGDVNYDNLLKFFNRWSKIEIDSLNEIISGNKTNDGGIYGDRDDINENKYKITVIDVKNCRIDYDGLDYNSKFPDNPISINDLKNRYYYAKMGICNQINIIEDGVVSDVNNIVRQYLIGIQWVLYYYYKGIISWSWYLPYKYPPFIHDILLFLKSLRKMKNDKDVTLYNVLNFNFILSNPMTPYEQLMMVLPPQASYLLPDVLSRLMNEDTSALYRYYPIKFDVDMDNCNVSWGGVTLLPIIPQKLLIDVMNSVLLDKNIEDDILYYMESPKLTEEEKERNKFGIARIYYYNEEVERNVEAPFGLFNNLVKCHVDYQPFFNPRMKDGRCFPNQLWVPLGGYTERSDGRGRGWVPNVVKVAYPNVVRKILKSIAMKKIPNEVREEISSINEENSSHKVKFRTK